MFFSKLQFPRLDSGIPSIMAKDIDDFAFHQGLCHGKDRQLQLLFVKIIGEGRICELLDSSPESFEIDLFMKSLCFKEMIQKDIQKLNPETKKFLQSYCNGINEAIQKTSRPFAFILTRTKREEWRIEDCFLILYLMSYLGLAQAQGETEKFIIQSIKNNVSIDHLKSLFSPHLNGITLEQIDLIKKVKIFQKAVPENIKFLSGLPKLLASNNWSVSSQKSENGQIFHCNDPHLEVNRLPAIWYEMKISLKNKTFFGITLPGVPGIMMGRNQDLAFGFTYGFMDMIDFFIEEIRDQKILDNGKWTKIECLEDEILCKKNQRKTKIFRYLTPNGILETNVRNLKLEDGFYLSRGFSGGLGRAVKSFDSIKEILESESILDLQNAVKKISISCNWILSDAHGNIVYQQSGSFPHRKDSGLFPLQGWINENRWKGLRELEDLCTFKNPENGYMATANNLIKNLKGPPSINLPMASYRVDRISQLLESKEKLNIEDMMKIQSDLYSLQAEYFIKNLLSYSLDNDSKLLKMLKDWNFCYDKDSKSAVLFEKFYSFLLNEVFGKNLFGPDVWNFLESETSILADFFGIFDKILLLQNENDPDYKLWFSSIPPKDYFLMAWNKTEDFYKNNLLETWGNSRKIWMNNIFFNGKLPSFFKVDYGPIMLEGSRATIVQGSLYKSADRVSTFCPSWRFVTDLKDKECFSILAGGVSDRPFSSLYKSEIKKWLKFLYKRTYL